MLARAALIEELEERCFGYQVLQLVRESNGRTSLATRTSGAPWLRGSLSRPATSLEGHAREHGQNADSEVGCPCVRIRF
jgi:hypothetical protein